MADPLVVDVCIIGGGVAGLWTLGRLRHRGYSAVLLEREALGAGQTIWSQGIIHGGIKYALTGEASAASKAIAAMPGVWERALAGPSEGIDLSAVRPLSACQYLWTTPGLVSRLAGLAASKVIRTPVEKLPRPEWPAAFSGAPSGVDVYRVAEPVLPGREVVVALAQPHAGAMAKMHEIVSIEAAGDGVTVMARCAGVGADSETLRIRAGLLACAAGEGNERLAQLAGIAENAPMQRRPLHMVMLRGPRASLPEVFGHCLGSGTTPRVTVTTIDAADSAERVWYVGGAIAETGVTRSEPEQIEAAKQEVQACMPWVDFARSDLRWKTGHINRAEGLTASGSRPDVPVVVRGGAEGRVVIAWPTKLAFAPAMAEMIEREAMERGGPSGSGEPGPIGVGGAGLEVAKLPWG